MYENNDNYSQQPESQGSSSHVYQEYYHTDNMLVALGRQAQKANGSCFL